MAKYNYDKASLSGLGKSAFMNQVKTRQAQIEAASAEPSTSVYNANILAGKLHPDHLLGRIAMVMDVGYGICYVIEPLKEAGITEFPPFRAGQYASFEIDMGDRCTCRDYCLSWAPKGMLGQGDSASPECNPYMITVSRHGPGHMSDYIHQNWAVDTVVRFRAPLGKAYYEPLRDAENIMTIGEGGSGLVMAFEAADGIASFSQTAICLSPSPENIIARPLFEATAARSRGKVRYVPVLLSGEAPGCEKGPVTAEMIRKYITDPETGKLKDTTFFVTCSEEYLLTAVSALEELGIPKRRIRAEIQGERLNVCAYADYPKDKAGKQFKLRIWSRGEYKDTVCSSDKSIQRAIEEANIHVTTECRTGECGWCHSRLIKGEYFVPKGYDGRREADKKFGWIHPCNTYPLSDIEIEVFPSQ